MPAKPQTTAWATYIRCHDDIGWAITDQDAAAVGWDAASHRAFLTDFYAGRFPGSWAVGEDYQADLATGDRRTSGSLASLAGLESALAADDPTAIELAIRRILLTHTVILGWDGIPLIYMGDEIGLRNDHGYLDVAEHASDSRWLHRPRMDWTAAARRHQAATLEGRIFNGLRAVIDARRSSPELHAAVPLEVVESGDRRVFAFVRRHPVGPLLALHNMSAEPATVAAGLVQELVGPVVVDRLGPSRPRRPEGLRLEFLPVRLARASGVSEAATAVLAVQSPGAPVAQWIERMASDHQVAGWNSCRARQNNKRRWYSSRSVVDMCPRHVDVGVRDQDRETLPGMCVATWSTGAMSVRMWIPVG